MSTFANAGQLHYLISFKKMSRHNYNLKI